MSTFFNFIYNYNNTRQFAFVKQKIADVRIYPISAQDALDGRIGVCDDPSENEKMTAEVAALKENGVIPTLAILRVGERPDDLSYETGAMKRCAAVGVEVRNVVLPADVCQEDFDAALEQLNTDDSVHGILMFRPLPKQLDSERARQMLNPSKASSDGSLKRLARSKRLTQSALMVQ